MDRVARLELEVAELKRRLDALMGQEDRRQITLRDMILAAEKGDKLTVQKYWDQTRRSSDSNSHAGRV